MNIDNQSINLFITLLKSCSQLQGKKLAKRMFNVLYLT